MAESSAPLNPKHFNTQKKFYITEGTREFVYVLFDEDIEYFVLHFVAEDTIIDTKRYRKMSRYTLGQLCKKVFYVGRPKEIEEPENVDETQGIDK